MGMRAIREEGGEEEDSAEELSDEEFAELTKVVHGNQEDIGSNGTVTLK